MNTKIEPKTAIADFTLLDADKVKAIKTAIGGDRVRFDTNEAAQAKLTEAKGKTSAFFGLPIISGPIADESAPVTVATLGTRQNKVNGIKAIVVMQIPAVSAFIESAADFVAKLVEREAADAMFAELRNATTMQELTTAAERIPSTVEAIVSESRSGSTITAVFDEFWPLYFNGYLKEANPKLHDAMPAKNLVIKAIRSKSYAIANPLTAALEQAGAWVKLLGSMIRIGNAGGTNEKGETITFDTSSFSEWLETRDSVDLTYSTPKAKELDAAAAALDF